MGQREWVWVLIAVCVIIGITGAIVAKRRVAQHALDEKRPSDGDRKP